MYVVFPIFYENVKVLELKSWKVKTTCQFLCHYATINILVMITSSHGLKFLLVAVNWLKVMLSLYNTILDHDDNKTCCKVNIYLGELNFKIWDCEIPDPLSKLILIGLICMYYYSN